MQAVVIRFGGSLLVPNDPDPTAFLGLMEIIRKHPEYQFLIIIGGGGTSKKFQDILREQGGYSDETIDWMGIYALRCNAEFARLLARDLADTRVYNDPSELPGELQARVTICGAAAPGHSSNMDAVEVARHVGAKRILNVSNVSHVYTDNPKENNDAEPLEDITWDRYLEMIPSAWTPKLATPFDPVSARMARDLGVEVVIMDGRDQESIEQYLQGLPFTGTLIHP